MTDEHAPGRERGEPAAAPTPDARAARRAERERAAAFLDLEEGRGPAPVLDDAAIAELLRTSRRIAVVGASSRPGRPSLGVFRFLVEQGYECLPVNPAEREVLGIRAYPTLRAAAEAAGPIDIVDVFRRPELCVPHALEAVEVGARCLWLQLGIVNWEAARIAHAGGLGIVMDRCTLVEHRRLLG